MSNKFNHFIKNALLVCVGVAAISGLLLMSYMDSKNLTFEEIFHEGAFNIHLGDGRILDDFEELDLSARISSNYQRYETKDIYKEDTFDLQDNIKIITSTEEVLFIEEDRDDIQIIFEREVPDTSRYTVDYKAKSSGDQIVIEVDLRTNGYYAEKDYQGLITVYIPENHHFDQVTIKSSIASHNMVLPKDVDRVDLSVDFGSIYLIIDEPLQALELSLNAGDLFFEINAPVDKVEASLDTGELNFEVNETVDHLEINNKVGAIVGTLAVSPTLIEVECDLGDVDLEFYEPIEGLNAGVNIGDLQIHVSEDDEGLVYIDKDLVDFNSSLTTTNKKDTANITLNVDLGDVSID